MNLPDALQVIVPTAGPFDFLVVDDGAGPYVAFWDAAKLGPVPTPGQIAAVTGAQVKESRDMPERVMAKALLGAGKGQELGKALRAFVKAIAPKLSPPMTAAALGNAIRAELDSGGSD